MKERTGVNSAGLPKDHAEWRRFIDALCSSGTLGVKMIK